VKIEYLVGIVNPSNHTITHCIINDYDEVLVYANEKQRLGFDVIVLKKELKENGKEKLTLLKLGYGKFYAFINKIFIIVGFMLLILFSYLYYKFFKN
jgi:hypothetical protein